ncbi:MAG: hypothetical protein BTN85_0338 [Candidatus Methanohalarchaeum thermophilum]|uniref:Uncharacterized protein n=1 Tax=Methanohalarchaeum thermophilum TaxID=1903181 RepID=A0A1Q6DU58_METT1|nr:MAG: hypothetical protein BTN85_0338 [Candidatus Methanohalarchaeum thermophilum]
MDVVFICGVVVSIIFIQNLTKEEKKKLDIAKAKSGAGSWKEFILGYIKDEN